VKIDGLPKNKPEQRPLRLVLDEVRQKINEGHCKVAVAMTARGEVVPYDHPDADRYCLTGAIARVLHEQFGVVSDTTYGRVVLLIANSFEYREFRMLPGESPVRFLVRMNDAHLTPMLLSVLDHARVCVDSPTMLDRGHAYRGPQVEHFTEPAGSALAEKLGNNTEGTKTGRLSSAVFHTANTPKPLKPAPADTGVIEEKSVGTSDNSGIATPFSDTVLAAPDDEIPF